MVALFIKGSIKWVKDSIADVLIAAGTATRVTGTKLTSAAADAARANPITKASQLPKSVIDATKKANTPKPAAAKKPGGGADRSEAGKRAWVTRRKNPPSAVTAFMQNKQAAEAASSRKMGEAQQIRGATPVTPRSVRGMPLTRRGETRNRKSGGKVSAKKYAYGGRVAKYKG